MYFSLVSALRFSITSPVKLAILTPLFSLSPVSHINQLLSFSIKFIDEMLRIFFVNFDHLRFSKMHDHLIG